MAVAYLGLYAVTRFVIEFYRGDAVRGTVFHGMMSTSQFIAILVAAAALGLYPFLMRRRGGSPEPAAA